MTNQKIDYRELTAGYEFEPASFRLDTGSVLEYLDAVEGDKRIYEKGNIVPPMSIAALAMTAMSAKLSIPPGAIHVSQDLQFLIPVAFNESVTSYTRVNGIIHRGKFHMITIGINVLNKENTPVLNGETSFLLPFS